LSKEESLFELFNKNSPAKIDSDYLRMAVGFLDTNKLIEVGSYKTFVALVSLTRESIQKKRSFQMPVRKVMDEIGISSNNYDALKEYIRTLMETVLDFNIHKTDNNPGWGMAQILGPSELKDGIISFEFTEPVWEKLKDPIVYAYLTRKGVYSFRSKYQIALYNFFTRLLVPNHKTVIYEASLEFLLKDVLHIEKKAWKTYGSYTRLNDKILKNSIRYVNKHTNIHVTYDGLREGRSVVAVRFIIEQQRSLQKTQGSSKDTDKPSEMPLRVRRQLEALSILGLRLDMKTKLQISTLIDTLGEDLCVEKLSLIAKEVRQDPERFKNPGGYIRTQIFAIEEEAMEQQPEPKAILFECFELFVPYLLSAARAVHSKQSQQRFVRYLTEHYDRFLPTIEKLAQEDKNMRFFLRDLDLKEKAQVLQKPSVISLLKANSELFAFDETSFDIENLIEHAQEDVLRIAQEQIEPPLMNKLRTQLQQEKISYDDFEQFAIQSLKKTSF
jgi:hypothetical protein